VHTVGYLQQFLASIGNADNSGLDVTHVRDMNLAGQQRLFACRLESTAPSRQPGRKTQTGND
jgi:hypothetical protein